MQLTTKNYRETISNLHDQYYGFYDKFFDKLHDNDNDCEMTPHKTIGIQDDYGIVGSLDETRTTVNCKTFVIDKNCTNLELTIFNPEKRDFDSIFEQIELEVGGQRMSCIWSKGQFDIMSYKLDRKTVRQANGLLHVSIPFFINTYILETLVYHQTRLIVKLHDFSHHDSIKVYGDIQGLTFKEKELTTEKIDSVIPQYFFANNIVFVGLGKDVNSTYHTYELRYPGPIETITVLSNKCDIEKYILTFDGISYEVSQLELDEINKGHSPPHPTFFFEKTINFTLVDRADIEIFYNKPVPPPEIFGTRKDVWQFSSGMTGLKFGK